MSNTTWEKISEQARDDLVTWYNVRPEDLDDDDRARLVHLYARGLFGSWDCPLCGERCRTGDPDDWSHFQGVRGLDFVSYPGDTEIYQPELIEAMCDDCRSKGSLTQSQSRGPVGNVPAFIQPIA